jgi:hypothetical protein
VDGLTARLPDAAILPIPLLIEIVLAFVTPPQLNVEDPPKVIVLGEATNDPIAGAPGHGGTGVFTITVTWREIVPPQPVALKRYVVVFAGLTVRLPDAPTPPMPLSTTTESALEIPPQLKFTESPVSIVLGEAVKNGYYSAIP